MSDLGCWFKNEESGQGMVEYALIISVIAAIVIVVMGILGPKIVNLAKSTNLAEPAAPSAE